MTVEDLAATLGIGRNQAYEAVRSGKVRAMRLGHRWLIPRAEVARLTGVGATPTTAA
jgi:excisionase family DNA binding protein